MPSYPGEPVPLTTHYDVLELPRPPVLISKSDLKSAYRDALFRYHPDKYVTLSPQLQEELLCMSRSRALNFKIPTVDEIILAYKVLSDPRSKSEYDHTLSRNFADPDSCTTPSAQPYRTGLEIIDLDDMCEEEVMEDVRIWYRACRCGNERGFLVREEDLDKEVERGEIFVGCHGCSLWAKILFAVDDPAEADDQNEHEGGS